VASVTRSHNRALLVFGDVELAASLVEGEVGPHRLAFSDTYLSGLRRIAVFCGDELQWVCSCVKPKGIAPS
jgi:hypothetical protein